MILAQALSEGIPIVAIDRAFRLYDIQVLW